MKLCLFQGTFNPIHNAHLKICEYAKEKFHFDKILV
ncbi:MAG: adenylyltransferase/cytidyltransferase family protein, partial [Clostridium sp.]|nr:adenylyltransferase/cytidyltransferase family protein [Clostridium sp.]